MLTTRSASTPAGCIRHGLFQPLSRVSRCRPAATFALLAILGFTFAASARASGNPSVTVTNTAGPLLNTQLSTNDVWAGMLGQTPAGQSEFNTLHAPLVRLHIGDDGTNPPALPEINKNQWDFSSLDALVNDVFTAGEQPLLNIKFAPDWMWTCYPNSIGVSGSQGVGTVADQTFQTFAQYMARLVSYYNAGSMTTETGIVITNPSGTSHAIKTWELWNEPDLTNETPCGAPSGHSLTPDQYLKMWNAATAAMLQVDPTLRFVGPATGGSQFGSSAQTGNEYIDDLMGHAATNPAAISFHGYGYWDNSVSDKWLFDGDNSSPASHCCGGITDLTQGVQRLRAQYPNTPVWLTEVNVNAAWGADSYKRPWSEFGAAWWGAMFAETAPLGVGLIHEYDLVDGPQFGLIDNQTGRPYLGYYVTQLLDQAFPPGSILLSSNSSDSGIVSLAAWRPDGKISVMVVNRKLVSDTTRSQCGTGGVATPVDISLPGIQPVSATLQQIDARSVNCSTNAAIAPTNQTLSPSNSATVSFPGYGVAVLTFTPGVQMTPPPAITSVSPAAGSTAGGNSVTITGTNLAGATSVKFGSTAATITSAGPTQVTATAPPGSAGTVDVTVTTPRGTSASTAADQYSYGAPAVTGLSSAAGPTAGQNTVSINGMNFAPGATVAFGASPASNVTVLSPSLITATAPAGSGTVDVIVTTQGGSSSKTAADQYSYALAPAVSGMSPTTGSTAGGETVTIGGSNLAGATSVNFGDAAATILSTTNTQITATVPPGFSGTVDVTVTTPGGTSPAIPADRFTYTSAPPVISGLDTNAGPTAGGNAVTISGSNFTTSATVSFGNSVGSSVTVVSPTQIIVVAPAGSPGMVHITVTTPDGTSATGPSDEYTYVAQPTVTRVSPTSGPSRGGTTITITGSALSGAYSVSFGNATATILSNTDTQITVSAPAGSGTVDVTITTLGGTSTTAPADQYNYVAGPAPPTVAGVNPTYGPVAGGNTVAILGTNFVNGATVAFGGHAASNVAVLSPSELTATAPAGSSGTVDITVTTQGGTSATGPADTYTYVVAPAVRGVSPSSGPTAGGNSVKITGGALAGVTAVKFGSKDATSFKIDSDGQITAIAPAAPAGIVDVAVVSPGGTSAVSPADTYTYVPPPTPPAVTGVSPASGPTAGGTTVKITGSHLTGATNVKFGNQDASSLNVDNDGQITATAPPGSAGTIDITVTTPAGTSATTPADQYTYQPAKHRRHLTVSKAGGGNGVVRSSPARISCGSLCLWPFDDGQTVTLSPAPDAVSAFAGWRGAGCSGVGTCRLTMGSDATVIATFVKSPVSNDRIAGTDGVTAQQWVTCLSGSPCSIVAKLCPLGATCSDVASASSNVVGARSTRTAVLAQCNVRIPAHTRKLIALRLTRAGQRLLHSHGRVEVLEEITTVTNGHRMRTARTIVLAAGRSAG